MNSSIYDVVVLLPVSALSSPRPLSCAIATTRAHVKAEAGDNGRIASAQAFDALLITERYGTAVPTAHITYRLHISRSHEAKISVYELSE